MAHGHAPALRLYVIGEIYVADTDDRTLVQAQPWLR
jgi:hypothetical protein